MAMSLLVHHLGPDGNISTTIKLITMKFGIEIHGPQRMNPTDDYAKVAVASVLLMDK